MKKLWMGAAIVIVAAVAVSLIALPKSAEWTTSSPEALAAFSAAMDAKMKLYHAEAKAQLERAVELDPEFVVAKLFLADQIRYDDEDRAEALLADVVAADTSTLTDREAFYVERARAYQEGRFDEAARLIDAHLEKHPNDPYILHEKALKTWLAGEFDDAERLNRRLIEIAPNWIISYNQLGYIAMSQGRFAEAEEYFTSYRFVAPDQANPHDSLGELYLILGRHEEAEVSLRRSIEIRPDFWAAYDHLALVRMQANDYAGAEEVHAEAVATGTCPDYWDQGISCNIAIATLVHTESWAEIRALLDEQSECQEGMSSGYVQVMGHLAALKLGDVDAALAIEAKVKKSLDASEKINKLDTPQIIGAYNHLVGTRLALQGDYEAAIEALWTADENMNYMQAGSGLFKLYNKLYLVETLLAAGHDGKAHKVLSKVRSVNPALAAEFEENGLRVIGLERE